MSSSHYENALIELFGDFDKKNIVIKLAPHIVFVCGGPVDVKSLSRFTSVRHQLVHYIETNSLDKELNCELILAESFNDYFKENAYSDLLTFESDILNISSVAVIVLESPGSLVELGIFCNKHTEISKLFIVSDSDLVNEEDSFIFLGPLQYIKNKDSTSSVSYPFSGHEEINWPEIRYICDDFINKIKSSEKSQHFRLGHSGHLSFLIYEIICLASPILLEEIEMALLALEVEFDRKSVHRALYILSKLRLVKVYKYSNFYFYYPLVDMKRVAFGPAKSGKQIDRLQIKVHLKGRLKQSSDKKDEKRIRAAAKINSAGEL